LELDTQLSGRLNGQAALPPVPTVGMDNEEKTNLVPAGNGTPDRPDRILVPTPSRYPSDLSNLISVLCVLFWVLTVYLGMSAERITQRKMCK
jgi:hypothetical protein